MDTVLDRLASAAILPKGKPDWATQPAPLPAPLLANPADPQVAVLIPCLRHTSAVESPASCSRSTAMICSSVNLDRFIVRSFLQAGL